ncbi:MAG TPA: nuclear transport factor 2 family protein [Gaiellaceae bacterium]|nr:nuclear transport factor 2 family protein [Gaiellaceae bacterium]
MSNEENFELVRRFNQVFKADDDLSVLDEILAADFVAHNGDEDVRGPDGWRQFVLDARNSSGGDIETGIDELLGDGNLVAERWWIRSSGVGDAAANGHGVTVHRIANGRLQENWAVFQPED